jgi:hypothetical protein
MMWGSLMNFCCACLLCTLAIATESVNFATERFAEQCAFAPPCGAWLPLADLSEQLHPSTVPPTLGARWTAETSVTVSAAQAVVGRPTTQGTNN